MNSFLDNSENNPSFSENNPSFSEEKCTKESKTKENKINNKVKECVGEHTSKNAHTHLKQEDYIALCNKYGQYLVDAYIERTQSYKCCNVYTIEKWIIEDLENEQNRKAHFKEMKLKKNKFSNFPQREYSKEELSELERKLLEKSLK